VLPGYFEAVGARLLEGRFFTDADVPEATTIAIVDERLAQRMWPGESAIGQRFVGDPRTTGGPAVTVTVVGVVRHLKHRRPTQEVREQIYYPVRQAPRNPMAFVVRATVPPDVLAPQLRQAMTALGRRLAWSDVRAGARREPSGGREIGDRRSRSATRGRAHAAKTTSGLSIGAEGYPHARTVRCANFRQKLLTPTRLGARNPEQYPQASRPQARVIRHALRRRHRAS
jgi:hypothetical protein